MRPYICWKLAICLVHIFCDDVLDTKNKFFKAAHLLAGLSGHRCLTQEFSLILLLEAECIYQIIAAWFSLDIRDFLHTHTRALVFYMLTFDNGCGSLLILLIVGGSSVASTESSIQRYGSNIPVWQFSTQQRAKGSNVLQQQTGQQNQQCSIHLVDARVFLFDIRSIWLKLKQGFRRLPKTSSLG